ncbi:anti-sigma factor domain-containing protein [Thalassovita sp.]|uniref:anti-sigma factor n=1 Tax=Thalassovita sp. TaxID=1979401 RepID=UPI0029DE56F2|nr:anti-sigma factor [Thalassovita sp.]
MTGPQDTDLPGGDLAAAAEYALGLLPEDERAGFEARMAAEPALQQEVAAWAAQFAGFADEIAPVTPPPQIWLQLKARAFGREPRPFWRALLPYLGGAVAATALVWVVYITGLLTDQRAAPHLYADLVAQDRGLVLLAHWAPDSETFMLRRDQGDFPADSAYEIWVIPTPDAAPISVGLMLEPGLTQIPVPAALVPVLQPGVTVAITLEPPGGSPSGAPTGPVVAAGALEIRS